MMNYYKIHKNKRPKRVFRRKRGYVSAMFPLMSITAAMSASKIAITNSQPILDYPNSKPLRLAAQAINGALAIVKIIETEKLRRFKATGRYIK